jgi:hypothetical protein
LTFVCKSRQLINKLKWNVSIHPVSVRNWLRFKILQQVFKSLDLRFQKKNRKIIYSFQDRIWRHKIYWWN